MSLSLRLFSNSSSVVVCSFPVVISYLAICAFNQELTTRSVFALRKFFVKILRFQYYDMQRSESIDVLDVDVTTPTVKVVNCPIVRRVASPVHRSASVAVPWVDWNTPTTEENKAPNSVSVLRSHMHHVKTVSRLHKRISTMLHHKLYDVRSTVVARKVQRIVLITVLCRCVKPVSNNICYLFLDLFF